MSAKYINPYTDFGFKKLFGEEASKDLLLDFLNELLPEISNLTEEQRRKYENSLKVYRDLEGIKEGIIANQLQTAKKMIVKGFPLEDISDITGLPIQDITDIK